MKTPASPFQSGPEIPEGDDDDDTVGDDEKEEANNDDSFSQFTETSQILSEEQKQREKRQNSLVSIVTADYSSKTSSYSSVLNSSRRTACA